MSEPRPRTSHWTPNPDPTTIVVPGVDVTASINSQIDQVDQLITIRLQNIDANFSRIQHLIATKLLPAFKRYAEGTEPVREAAKFWKSFYEAAAQVRIPIASETSSFYQAEEDLGDQSAANISSQESNITPTTRDPPEDSFVRGAPIFSTPVIRDPTTVTLPRDDEDDESWAASIESPFERLGRQVRDLTHEEAREIQEYPSTSSAPSFSPLYGSYTGAVPGRRDMQATVHKISANQARPPIPNSLSSRKGKSPMRQSVLRQNAAIRSRGLRTPGPPTSKRDSSNNGYNSDSSDDLFPPGMSPPVTMQFAMVSRARASPAKLAPTPARKAAERIGRDLVANAVGKGTGPAKYFPSPVQPPGSHAYHKGSGKTKQFQSPLKATGETTIYSDSDSDSSEHDESNPSAGHLKATGETTIHSDSDSDSSEHDESNPSGGFLFIKQNNARTQEDPFDQSIVQADEETVFGARLVGQGGEARPRLTLMGDALIDETHPGAVSLNPFAQVEQTPTPCVRGSEDLS